MGAYMFHDELLCRNSGCFISSDMWEYLGKVKGIQKAKQRPVPYRSVYNYYWSMSVEYLYKSMTVYYIELTSQNYYFKDNNKQWTAHLHSLLVLGEVSE